MQDGLYKNRSTHSIYNIIIYTVGGSKVLHVDQYVGKTGASWALSKQLYFKPYSACVSLLPAPAQLDYIIVNSTS